MATFYVLRKILVPIWCIELNEMLQSMHRNKVCEYPVHQTHIHMHSSSSSDRIHSHAQHYTDTIKAIQIRGLFQCSSSHNFLEFVVYFTIAWNTYEKRITDHTVCGWTVDGVWPRDRIHWNTHSRMYTAHNTHTREWFNCF